MPETKERCCKERGHQGWNHWQCSRKGTVRRDGKWYCAQHDPVAVEAKAESWVDGFRAKLDAQKKNAEKVLRLSAAQSAVWELAKNLLMNLEEQAACGDFEIRVPFDIIDKMRAEISKADQ